MTGVLAYQHGIYPRPEAVVAATRDVDRGRTTQDRVDGEFRAGTADFVAAQQEAGLDFFSDGLLHWQDIFRPLVRAAGGRAQSLVRWFDNNAFFRAPEFEGPLRLDESFRDLAASNGVPAPRVATLPSPYLFSRAAFTDRDRDVLMEEIGRELIAPAVAVLVELGYGLIHLQEPWLTFFGIDDQSWRPFEQTLGVIRQAAGTTPLVLHTYFGNAAPHAERLRNLPVDAVGVDFVETDFSDLPAPWGTGLAAGCLDGRRSVLESPDETADFVLSVTERLQPTSLYVSANCDLELLGPEIARAKLGLLGETARRIGDRR